MSLEKWYSYVYVEVMKYIDLFVEPNESNSASKIEDGLFPLNCSDIQLRSFNCSACEIYL